MRTKYKCSSPIGKPSPAPCSKTSDHEPMNTIPNNLPLRVTHRSQTTPALSLLPGTTRKHTICSFFGNLPISQEHFVRVFGYQPRNAQRWFRDRRQTARTDECGIGFMSSYILIRTITPTICTAVTCLCAGFPVFLASYTALQQRRVRQYQYQTLASR